MGHPWATDPTNGPSVGRGPHQWAIRWFRAGPCGGDRLAAMHEMVVRRLLGGRAPAAAKRHPVGRGRRLPESTGRPAPSCRAEWASAVFVGMVGPAAPGKEPRGVLGQLGAGAGRDRVGERDVRQLRHRHVLVAVEHRLLQVADGLAAATPTRSDTSTPKRSAISCSCEVWSKVCEAMWPPRLNGEITSSGTRTPSPSGPVMPGSRVGRRLERRLGGQVLAGRARRARSAAARGRTSRRSRRTSGTARSSTTPRGSTSARRAPAR